MDQKERMSRLLFLEFNRDKAAQIFQTPSLTESSEDLFVPVNPDFLVEQITENQVPSDLPVSEIIIGMAYASAIDPEFKYAPEYRLMLRGHPLTEAVLKQNIAKLYREKKATEAYILLKGLFEVDGEEETENLLLAAGEELALRDPSFLSEVMELAELAIENDNRTGWLIKGSLESAQGQEESALAALKNYIAHGGEKTPEVLSRMEELDRNTKAEEAYSLLYDDPKASLKILLELLPSEEDNPRLIYSIAVAYRLLGNHEKAIFYLEEAQALDPAYLDVLNELGLNYALIGDHITASRYFRTVYETIRDIGPLTNLIISLFNLGEQEEAIALYQEAKRQYPDDEILDEIQRIYLEPQGGEA